jgi:sec-independent protein translocase protein TatC
VKQDEDLFKDTTMTFGEHLEDLRSSLFKALFGLVAGFLIGLMIGDHVVLLIEAPLTKALGTYFATEADERYQEFVLQRTAEGKSVPYPAAVVDALVNQENMLYDILWVDPQQTRTELGQNHSTSSLPTVTEESTPERVHAAASELHKALVPILVWHPIAADSRVRIKSFSAPEAFSIWVKASLLVGVLISSPWVFYHLWAFVAAGLYPHERRYVHVFLPFSLGLFLLGAATAYLFVFGPVLNFLFGFNRWLGLDPDPRITEWLSFVLMLPLGFGISFQLPLVMLFLERIGVFDVKAYLEKWRLAVLVIFILSAVLTPADPYSLLLMALPLCFLYFFGVGLCRYLPKHPSAFES